MASSGLELLWVSLPQLGKGAAQTLSISFLSIAFSTVGGVLYGVLRTLNNKAINGVLRVYLELFRAIAAIAARQESGVLRGGVDRNGTDPQHGIAISSASLQD